MFDLLEYLIRNRERVVSKDDLIERSLGWTHRLRCGADDPPQCRPSAIGDTGEEQRLYQNTSAKGLSFRRTVREEE